MRFEKHVDYAGFKVSIAKADNASPYLLMLDATMNQKTFLVRALKESLWTVDLDYLAVGKHIWFKKLTGPTQTVLIRELHEHIDGLYQAHKIIEFEESRKEFEKIHGKNAEFYGY